ncbi:hypothetical protein TNCV_2144011 [Trichonephila clavipes]|nr:hypothetical protein TNCV_2144011 [Trichonephila clavipes]
MIGSRVWLSQQTLFARIIQSMFIQVVAPQTPALRLSKEIEKVPVNLRADSLNPLGGPISRHQSSLISECSGFAHGPPEFSPNSNGARDNRLARLKPTPMPYLTYHLDGYKSPCHFDTEDVFIMTGRHSFSFK